VIVPAGATIAASDALELAQLLADGIRAGLRPVTPAAHRYVAELEEVGNGRGVSGSASDRVRSIDDAAVRWLSATEAAIRRGVEPRTITRRAAAGKIPARKVGGRWQILEEATERSSGSRSASRAP
jgi:hypothetical protein